MRPEPLSLVNRGTDELGSIIDHTYYNSDLVVAFLTNKKLRSDLRILSSNTHFDVRIREGEPAIDCFKLGRKIIALRQFNIVEINLSMQITDAQLQEMQQNAPFLNASITEENIEELKFLLNTFKFCPNLQILNLSGRCVCDRDMIQFMEGLACCKNLQSLDLSRNCIESSFTHLEKYLPNFSKLSSLNMSANPVRMVYISNGFLQALGRSCADFQDLDLSNLDITCFSNHNTMLSSFSQLSTLRSLNLYNVEFANDYAEIIGAAISLCTNLTCLTMGKTHISDDDNWLELMDQLSGLTQMRSLKITDDNLGSLSTYSIPFKSLTHLDLSNNLLKDDGCIHIADAMEEFCMLKTLNLSNNGIGHEGTKHLQDGIKQCELTSLNLENNPSITSKGLCHLAIGMKMQHEKFKGNPHRTINNLNLQRNGIDGRDGLKSIAFILRLCPNLQNMNISENHLDGYCLDEIKVKNNLRKRPVHIIMDCSFDGFFLAQIPPQFALSFFQ